MGSRWKYQKKKFQYFFLLRCTNAYVTRKKKIRKKQLRNNENIILPTAFNMIFFFLKMKLNKLKSKLNKQEGHQYGFFDIDDAADVNV